MSRSVLLALAATLVAGCGGGGGGDNSSNPPPPPASGDAITSGNGLAVATDVVTSTQFVKDLGLPNVAGPFVPTQVTMRPESANSILALGIGDAVRRGVQAMSNPESRQQIAACEDDDPTCTAVQCTKGGDITITANLADETTLTAGDVVTVFFDSCAEASGTLDGGVDLTVTNVDGDPNAPPFSADLDVAIDSVSLAQADSMVSANGTIGATISSESAGSLEFLLSGSELATVLDSETITLRDFTIDETDDLDAGQYTLNVAGTMESDVQGTYDFETPTTLAGEGGQFPSAGEILVHGADDTSARITALDNTNVRLELDTDGDGEADESTDTTWDALTTSSGG
jgi:hypothetical protein